MAKKAKAESRVVLPGSEKAAPKNARAIGTVAAAERVNVTIRLRRRRDAGTPAVDGQPLTREQFREAFGADPADVEKVEEFANAHGLDVLRTSLAERAVRLSGTAAAMQKAFGTRLRSYQVAKKKDRFRGRTGGLQVPEDLAEVIEAVFGLDNRPQARSHICIKPPSRLRSRAADGAKPLTALQVAKLYNFPTSRDGRGQCIGILELGGGYRTADLTAYFKGLGIKKPSVTAVSIDGAHNEPDGPTKDANAEVMLDIEVAGAVAPGARIAVYFAPNTDEGFLNALTGAVHDNVRKPSVISISWGAAESDWTTQAKKDFDEACRDAAAMGVTVTVSAGDHGASDSDSTSEKRANADFPASSPNVLACGGTRLIGGAKGIVSETVWNNHDGWATGGGVSEFFSTPAYQAAAGVPNSVNPGGKPGRGVPDICGNADSDTGYLIRVDGKSATVGGTSAVSPLWAGLIALLNQGRTQPIGFLTPKLYALPASAAALRDITDGDNTVNAVAGYHSGPGWDACTGLGSPDGAKLLAAL